MLVFAAFTDGGVTWDEVSEIPEWLLDEKMVTHVTTCGGFALLVSWMTLLIGRRWRPERQWIDRLGRAMGYIWILAALAVLISQTMLAAEYDRHFRTNGQNAPSAILDAEP